MRTVPHQPSLSSAWGKAKNATSPHPVICHIIDTTAVATQIYGLLLGPQCRTALKAAFARLGDAWRWIAVLCGLHDIGKYSPAFQALRSDLAVELLGECASSDIRCVARLPGLPRTDTPHGVITELYLGDLLRRWGATQPVASTIASALGGHHGYFALAAEVRQARAGRNHHGGPTWSAWRDSMVYELLMLWELPAGDGMPWADIELMPADAVALAALASVSDWIASDTTNFPYAEPGLDLAAYVQLARQRAANAVARLEWSSWHAPEDSSFAHLFPDDQPPRPIQIAVEQITRDCREPMLLLLEAPTGEGKSKAALQSITSLVHNLGTGGAYIAMPTRATSNQMRAEFRTMVNRLGQGETVRLVHSSADEHLAAEAAVDAAGATTPSGIGVDHPEDDDVAAREWFTHKKSLLTGLGVGTIDQMLKAGIRSGHVVVRLAGLANKIVVVDEVHAYDTYMSTLLDRLLQWLGRLGTSVVLLSATLPAARRAELVAAWQTGARHSPAPTEPVARDSAVYPRVTWTQAKGGVQVRSVGTSEVNQHRDVTVVSIADDKVVAWALDRVRSGGSVAIIHNLVRRVQASVTALQEAIQQLPVREQPALFSITGRLGPPERRTVENQLQEAFGPTAHRPTRAVVVGTQVLQESLDLDFDALVSDMAPIDCLIQRMGRIGRHRYGAERPDLVMAVTGVTDTPTGPRFPPYTNTVYQPMLMLRTWALLRPPRTLRCPDQVPELVDTVYGPAESNVCPAGWEDAWTHAADRLQRALAAEKHDAAVHYLPPPDAMEHLRELTVRPKDTRHTRSRRGRP